VFLPEAPEEIPALLTGARAFWRYPSVSTVATQDVTLAARSRI